MSNGTMERTPEGDLFFICDGCAAESPPKPDAPGNALNGDAWKAAVAEGWTQTLDGVFVCVWCPKCRVS